MLKRCSLIIDSSKSNEFKSFLKTNAKDKKFWDMVKREASKNVDKEELDKLFE